MKDYGHPRSITPVYPKVSDRVQAVLEDSVLSGADAKEELNHAVDKIDAKLKRYVLEEKENEKE